MLNNVTLMGRLVADPELKTTQNGTSVASFRLAVDRNYQPKGATEKQADFIPCVAWRQTAEFISKYFTKGRTIAVEGSLQSRNYEDKQGQKRTAIEVIVERVHFTGERAVTEQASAPPASAAPAQPAAMPASPPPSIPGDPYAPPAQYGLPGNIHYPGTLDVDFEGDPYEGDLPF